MDSKSLFLTANADTLYYMGILDLSKGPMVLEMPPRTLGAIDDQWSAGHDIGLSGPDRGEGGKYLILPPDYNAPLPEGGFFIAHAKTNYVVWFARSFLEDKGDPKPVAKLIKKATKVYPYEAGGLAPASRSS